MTPPSPSYPFEMIAADYFHLDGWNYLVLSDRYSGWISVYRTGRCEYDANRLVEALKEHFISWGVAAECASDIFDEKSAESLCAKTWIECEKLFLLSLSKKTHTFFMFFLIYSCPGQLKDLFQNSHSLFISLLRGPLGQRYKF